MDPKKRDSRNDEIDNEIKAPEEFARLIIVPLSECLQAVYAQTGDTNFVNTRLSGVAPALRLLIIPGQHEEEVAKNAAKLFVREADELAEFVFFADIAPNAGTSEPNTRSKSIRKACDKLLFMMVAKERWSDRKDKITRNPKQLEGWISNHENEAREVYADVYPKCDTQREPGIVFRARVGSGNNPRCGAREDFLSEIASEIAKHVSDFLAAESYQRRPYISIIYASVMAQLGRYEAALVELDRWIQQAKTRRNWYLARALNLMTILTEEWIRRPSTDVNSVTREYHIANLEEESKLFEELFDLAAFRQVYAAQPHSVEELGFRDRPKDHSACVSQNDANKNNGSPKRFDALDKDQFEDLRRAFTVMVSANQLISHNALLHPEYPLRYSHEVARIVGDFNNMDLHCLKPVQADDGIDQMRAESLRLHGEMKLRSAPIISSIKGNSAADDELKSGLDATELGLEIIRPLEQRDRSSRGRSEDSSDTLLDRIESTRSKVS
jgi:hypothetical protein